MDFVQITQQLLQQDKSCYQIITEENLESSNQINKNNQGEVISSQKSIISSAKQLFGLNDQTRYKKNLKNKVRTDLGFNKVELQSYYETKVEEEVEESINQSQIQQSESLFRSKNLFACQQIITNQQFSKDVLIYSGKLLISDQIVRKSILNNIIGNLQQSHEKEEKQGEQMKSISSDFNINNYINNKKQQTIQKLYYNKSGTYCVSVKTNISKDGKKLVILKTFEKDFSMSSEEFKSQLKIEIDILNYIQEQNTQVTLPFMKYEFLKEQSGIEKCILYIDSGLKSLDLVYKQYQVNKNYEHYNLILEFGFCQLLQKLNQMHKICKIAHSDIKPQNIVIGYDLNFYFIDFGASVFLDKEESYSEYLQSYTPIYNLQIYKDKRNNKEWKQSEVISCDYAQLIITFLVMIDVERKYFFELQKFDVNKCQYYKNKINPEFKRLGYYLIDCLSYIYQMQERLNIQPPKQKIFLISDFGGYFKQAMSNLYDIIYNQKQQQYEIISINRFSIQIIDLILQKNQNSKFLIDETTQIDTAINQRNDETDVSQYQYFCNYFELKEKDILYFGLTDYKFNNKGQLIQQFLKTKDYKIPLIQLQEDVPIFIIEQLDVSIIHVYFKYNSQRIQKNLMGFEMKKQMDLFQININSIIEDQINSIIKALKKKTKKASKLQKIIITFDENQYFIFQNQIPKLNEKCQINQKQLFLQIFVSNIDNLSNYLAISDNNLYLAIQIQKKYQQLDLMDILKHETHHKENTLIIAESYENQSSNFNMNFGSFQTCQLYDRYYTIEKTSQENINQDSTIELFKKLIKDFLNDIQNIQYKSATKKQDTQNILEKKINQIFLNILQNKNQIKPSYIFLISFQENILESNLRYSPNFFKNIQIVENKKALKIKDSIKLKLYSEDQKQLIQNYEYQSIINYLTLKIPNNTVKQIDLDFQNINITQDQRLVQFLKDELKELKISSLSIKLTQCCIDFKTFLEIDFDSQQNIQDILDYFYQNQILFIMNVQNSKLKQLNGSNQLKINFVDDVVFNIQSSQAETDQLDLAITQTSSQKLLINSEQQYDFLVYDKNEYYVSNDLNITNFDERNNRVILPVYYIQMIMIISWQYIYTISLKSYIFGDERQADNNPNINICQKIKELKNR
ncbi:hypothetical protein ABPG74_019573 [Tetrahymena malaccensis]